ncbi:MarR family transcriptional regulator [Bifidobacterium biavatii]|uniref:MarR family transcriptional regulator n=1 Tax=Bifidobacterium biavatii TaxID=762212 RepID=UPI00136483C4
MTIATVEGKVTPKRLAEKVGVHSRTASRTLKQLVQQGLLHWHGSGPRDPKQYYSQD